MVLDERLEKFLTKYLYCCILKYLNDSINLMKEKNL